MAITKQKIQTIHEDIDAALKEIALKHNLSVGRTHITYSDTGFKLTGEFGDKSEMGDVNPSYFRDMQRNGFIHGLSTDDIGKEITLGARIYKIEGMKGRVTVIGKFVSGDNKLYKLDPKDVVAVLKK